MCLLLCCEAHACAGCSGCSQSAGSRFDWKQHGLHKPTCSAQCLMFALMCRTLPRTLRRHQMTTAMTRESRAMRKHSPRAPRLRLAPRGQHRLVCLQQGNHPLCVGWAERWSRHSQPSVLQLWTQAQASTVWAGLHACHIIHDPVCCSCEGTQAQASTVWAGLHACLVIHNQVCCSCDGTRAQASTGQCTGLS